MRSTLATLALTGALGLSGAALLAPAVSYAATGDSTALTSRVDAVKTALTGLVSDGTITQAQADEVATAVASTPPERRGSRSGRGGHGGGRVDLAVAAKALGLTEAELRTAAAQGKTLAQLAEQEGVSEAALVKALVAAEKTRLAEAVADGRLTQAEADARAADASVRITAALDAPLKACDRGGRGPGNGTAPGGSPSSTPSTAPSATPSATTSSSA